MSLRGRLLVLLVLLNVLVLGAINLTAVVVQDRWREEETQKRLDRIYQDYGYFLPVGESLRDPGYTYSIPAVRRILGLEFERHFRDVMIVDADGGTFVDINPLGAANRDLTTFSTDTVHEGIRRALAGEIEVEVAGGRCVVIKTDSGEVAGGAWFVASLPEFEDLPFIAYSIPVLISTVVFALIAGWIVTRTMGPPIDRLGEAARRVESGDYSARVPALESAPELKPVVDAFNAMASKVEGHTAELKWKIERATDEAAAKERALVVSSRLASMGSLVAGVAHEINNPIGGMLNAVRRLSQSEELEPRQKEYLALVQRGLERMTNTVRRLLEFSPRVLEPVEFPIEQPIEGARALVEHRIQDQGVSFETQVSPELPTITGEPHEIQQVLLNLFLNSLNAMRQQKGGLIRVRVAVVGAFLELCVEDDGPGAGEDVLKQAMDPFFSVSNRPDSSGLGLFISYTIIHNHGGEMTLDSTPGAGFRVRLTLPIGGPA